MWRGDGDSWEIGAAVVRGGLLGVDLVRVGGDEYGDDDDVCSLWYVCGDGGGM